MGFPTPPDAPPPAAPAPVAPPPVAPPPVAPPPVAPPQWAPAAPAADEYPVKLTVTVSGELSRLWGIPIVGLMVRYIALIPHLIVMMILFLVGFLALIVLWIPILITGKYPGWALTLYSGLLRYAARVEAYLLLLPIPYPPFSLS